MPNRWIPYIKVLVHLQCLVPFAGFVYTYTSGRLALQADPVLSLTHWTGNWALYMLFLSLAVTPVRRLHPRLSNLIRFRRMLGLYAFFYASLHLATYIFLFSGYDLPTAWNSLRHGHPGGLWTQWRAIWPNVLEDLQKRKFIQVGLFAWVILLALTLTSPQFVLRAMGGRNWQRLHRLVYVAGIAACIHYWWLVKRGNRQPLADTLILTGLLLARLIWMWNKKRGQRVPLAGTKLRPTVWTRTFGVCGSMAYQDDGCGLQMEQAEDPFAFFSHWMNEAKQTELNDPNAMSLATATADGRPSVRIVLLKQADARGFTFYTNRESRKGVELLSNPHAALCLHWKSRQREVRVEGMISELPGDEVDAYWKRRARMSQIGAWASQQSRPLASREELLARTEEMEKRFPGEVPRPAYWTGFLVAPESIEFWQECDFRLHDRCVFTPDGFGGWTRQRLYP